VGRLLFVSRIPALTFHVQLLGCSNSAHAQSPSTVYQSFFDLWPNASGLNWS